MGKTKEWGRLDSSGLHSQTMTIPTKKKAKKKKTPMEFSKKILLFAGFVNVIVIGFSLVMMWRTCDLTPLAYLIPAVAAETATGTGFYYTKAKVENRLKLMHSYNLEINQQTFEGNGGYNG